MWQKFMAYKNIDCGLLMLRLSIGCFMFIGHGLPKLIHFDEMFHTFADPLHISHEASYILVVFAEALCSILIILGLWTRLALLPLLIDMLVIAVLVDLHQPWNKVEFALLYFVAYTTLFVTGAGRYSLDYRLFERWTE